MAPGRLSGEYAVVTGGGRGIGAAICQRLSADGASVAVLDIDGDSAEQTAAALRAGGAAAVAAALDIADAARVASVMARLGDQWGQPTLLVNNAGLAQLTDLATLERADWDRMLSINLTGAMLMSKAVLPALIERGGGSIVNMSSLSATLSMGHQFAYGTAKSALLGMTRAMAMELGPHNITVNAVCPGPVDTAAARAVLTVEARRAREERIPMHRLATTEDVAGVVAFLCSKDASYINGLTLYVDGGLHIAGIG